MLVQACIRLREFSRVVRPASVLAAGIISDGDSEDPYRALDFYYSEFPQQTCSACILRIPVLLLKCKTV